MLNCIFDEYILLQKFENSHFGNVEFTQFYLHFICALQKNCNRIISVPIILNKLKVDEINSFNTGL